MADDPNRKEITMTTNNFRQSVTGRIIYTHRLSNTESGNPRWEVGILHPSGIGSEHITSSDISLAYGLNDRDDLRQNVTEFGLTRAGRLNGYTRTPNA